MFETLAYPMQLYESVYIFVDPAAGGPSSDYAILSCTRHQGVHCVIGLDTLSGCKDPEKQFRLLTEHIKAIQAESKWSASAITVFVEHNLGFEAEHHERALRGLKNVSFYKDVQRQRVGVLTTLSVKHAMCTLVNAMLRERRLCVRNQPFISREGIAAKKLLRDELEIYSYQFKSAATVFQKTQVALSGKV